MAARLADSAESVHFAKFWRTTIVGVSTFVQSQQKTFLADFDARRMPADLNRNDKQAMQAWLMEEFQDWLEEHREELLANHWIERGWAKMVLAPDDRGQLQQTCQVKAEHQREVEAWMADEID
jgi:hypothetical protein